jgi:electron transfer flavoprotein beta subunit
MNIVVCLKQTFDTEAKVVLDSSGKIDGTGVNLVINPYDEFAVEEALRLKEKFGGEVTVVSMGNERVQEAIRTALAMGCDQAVLVNDPAIESPDEWVAAEILAKAISQIPCDIILAGRIAVDDGSSQVAVRLAEALDIPSVSSILKLEAGEGKAAVTREIDGGTELIEVSLPAVLTAQKGLNEPRYPTMMGIMKAKKKELKALSLADLGISAADLPRKTTVVKFSLPSPRKSGVRIAGEAADAAKELARLLREEAKVI